MLKRRNEISDKTLTQQVQQMLSNRGLRPPCNITVTVNSGVVTVSGRVEHSHQKSTAMSAARGVAGARGFVDQLEVTPIEKNWA